MPRLLQSTKRQLPTTEDLRRYCANSLQLDMQAGLAVAVFAVPQAMAYAMLAGVPPVHGIYAAVVMSIVAALFGSSQYVNTGPTNSAAMLTAAATAPFAGDERFLSIVFSFALLVGVIRLIMGLARMGRLADYVPDSGFLGFTVGVGILIAVGQIHHLFGLENPALDGMVARLAAIATQLNQTNPYALAIGLGALLIMLVGDRIGPRFPSALAAIAAATLAAVLLVDPDSVLLVRDIAPVPSHLLSPNWPLTAVDLWPTLFPSALAVAIVGLAEAVSIGETLAIKHGRSLDYNREFTGQGISQIVAAFFQGIPGSGSFSRSTLIELAGGQTRFANVAFGVFTALTLILAPGILNRIPIAALAGLLLFIALKLIDVGRIRRVWKTSRADTFVMLLTLLTTIFSRVEYGILVGIVTGALIQLNRASKLRLGELLPESDGGFLEQPYEQNKDHQRSDVVAVAASGDLYYGISNRLRDELNRIIHEQEPSHLILRVRRAYSIDYSCWSAIFDIAAGLQPTGGRLYLCGTRPDFAAITDLAHMKEVIPDSQVFPAQEGLFRSFQQCLQEIFQQDIEEDRLSDPWKDYFNKWRDSLVISDDIGERANW